jgi:hypothetical protein
MRSCGHSSDRSCCLVIGSKSSRSLSKRSEHSATRAWNELAFLPSPSASAPSLIGLFCGTLLGVSTHPRTRDVAIRDWNGELQLSGSNFASFWTIDEYVDRKIDRGVRDHLALILRLLIEPSW